jgi:hypothetical protein
VKQKESWRDRKEKESEKKQTNVISMPVSCQDACKSTKCKIRSLPRREPQWHTKETRTGRMRITRSRDVEEMKRTNKTKSPGYDSPQITFTHYHFSPLASGHEKCAGVPKFRTPP